jgi:hypothetical protein
MNRWTLFREMSARAASVINWRSKEMILREMLFRIALRTGVLQEPADKISFSTWATKSLALMGGGIDSNHFLENSFINGFNLANHVVPNRIPQNTCTRRWLV